MVKVLLNTYTSLQFANPWVEGTADVHKTPTERIRYVNFLIVNILFRKSITITLHCYITVINIFIDTSSI